MLIQFLLVVLFSTLPDSAVSKWNLKKGESLIAARIVLNDTNGTKSRGYGLAVTGKGSRTEAKAEDSEFVYFKLKNGSHELRELTMAKCKIGIASGYMKFFVPEEQGLYSLGTLTFKRLPLPPKDREEMREKSAGEALGGVVAGGVGGAIVGALLYSQQSSDECPLDVNNFKEEDEAEAKVKSYFPGLVAKRIRLEVDRVSN